MSLHDVLRVKLDQLALAAGKSRSAMVAELITTSANPPTKSRSAMVAELVTPRGTARR